MSHLKAWLCIAIGILISRAFGSDTPAVEHLAGAYFSALALVTHALLFKEKPPPAPTEASNQTNEQEK